uniref:Uncharacterized protein n=1 Tax=Knipowitschia caucasica TaxID=637954 RepID=A0AAV2KI29_KNICA
MPVAEQKQVNLGGQTSVSRADPGELWRTDISVQSRPSCREAHKGLTTLQSVGEDWSSPAGLFFFAGGISEQAHLTPTIKFSSYTKDNTQGTFTCPGGHSG